MSTVLFAFPGNENLAGRVRSGISAESGRMTMREFPDGETYLKIESDVFDKRAIVVASLHKPNDKFLPLTFFLRLLRDAGASEICLVAPYLAYMRQDKQFKPGEAVTSKYFGEIFSPYIDLLVTVDPHLHRRHSMSEIYSSRCIVLHAADKISEWIKQNVRNAVLIGPDSESEQWVSSVASSAGAPFAILEKQRFGDRNVEISVPSLDKFKGCTPVLVDDIISSGHTMMETARQLAALGFKPPVCVGVHAVFTEEAFEELSTSKVSKIVTSNTIPHKSNGIDLSPLIIESLKNE